MKLSTFTSTKSAKGSSSSPAIAISTHTATAAFTVLVLAQQAAAQFAPTSTSSIRKACGTQDLYIDCKSFAPVNNSAILYGWYDSLLYYLNSAFVSYCLLVHDSSSNTSNRNPNLNYERIDAPLTRLSQYMNPPAVIGMFTQIDSTLKGQSWDKEYKNDFDDMLDQMKGRNAILLASLDPFESYQQVTDGAIQEVVKALILFSFYLVQKVGRWL
jgi:hypothetical protein